MKRLTLPVRRWAGTAVTGSEIAMADFFTVLPEMMVHPYLLLFIALLFVGEAALLPAVYLALQGRMELMAVTVIALAAAAVSDGCWYLLGRCLPLAEISRWRVFARRKAVFDRLNRLYTTAGLRTVFISKFVYGTRTAAQVLAGSSRMPFRRYVTINSLGIVALVLMMVLVGKLIIGSFTAFQHTAVGLQLAFGLFVVTVIGLQLGIKRWYKTKFQS